MPVTMNSYTSKTLFYKKNSMMMDLERPAAIKVWDFKQILTA